MEKDLPEKCPCKWVKCKRHGKCDECIAHHKKSEKYPLPFCFNKKKTKP